MNDNQSTAKLENDDKKSDKKESVVTPTAAHLILGAASGMATKLGPASTYYIAATSIGINYHERNLGRETGDHEMEAAGQHALTGNKYGALAGTAVGVIACGVTDLAASTTGVGALSWATFVPCVANAAAVGTFVGGTIVRLTDSSSGPDLTEIKSPVVPSVQKKASLERQ